MIVAAELPENHWLPAVLFGSGLVVLGAGMMVAHWRSWKRQNDAGFDPADRDHYASRFRRRMQTSALIATAGVLLALGDVFIWRFGVAAATVFWLLLLILVCWIALLAVGDMTAIQSHSRNRLADLETHRRLLEQELAALRAQPQGQPGSLSAGNRPVSGERSDGEGPAAL